MSTPENGPESIDEFLASLETNFNEVDVVADFARDLLSGGLRGLAMRSPEGLSQFKDLYGQVWDRTADILVATDASWRQQETPRAQIDSLLGSIWDLKDTPGQHDIAVVAFVLAHNDDQTEGVWGDIFGTTSYFGKNELRRTLESICLAGNLGKNKSPDETAAHLLNLSYVLYALYAANGEMLDRTKFLSAVQDLL